MKIYINQNYEILKQSLSQCIGDCLDKNIRYIAKRSVWLGNDCAGCASYTNVKMESLEIAIDILVSEFENKDKESDYLKSIEKKWRQTNYGKTRRNLHSYQPIIS